MSKPIIPSLPKGFHDTDATTVLERRHIIHLLASKCLAHGFTPLETPAMEHLDTLMGQYGAEGDRLLFKVLNSGDALSPLEAQHLTTMTPEALRKVSKKGLRYDLTLPLARYVAQNSHALTFPFKRYQIQPVWRADRPQKGRYREFYQCDIDIVGTTSRFHEALLLALVDEMLNALGLSTFTIHLNHRKLLAAFAHSLGSKEALNHLCRILDKTDKLGSKAVQQQLIQEGFPREALERLSPYFDPPTTTQETLKKLRALLGHIPAGDQALNDLETILGYLKHFGPAVNSKIVLTTTLARGMSYYTDAIFEVKADPSIGSIIGGGRYDTLIASFGRRPTPGVGLSFGLSRLHDLLKQQGNFPPYLLTPPQILVVPTEPAVEPTAIAHWIALRHQAITAVFYPTGTGLKKIFTYAHKKNIPWVAVVGPQEEAAGHLSLKNMQQGHQAFYGLDALVCLLKETNNTR